MSLRTFHLVFVLAVIVLTELFGAWAVYQHRQTGHVPTLVLGVLSFAFGFGSIVYAIWLTRKLDKTRTV